MATLFTEDFVRSLARLRIIARQVPGGGRHAEHRSRQLGGGIEFRDFRSYVPGDDIRRVDWNLYRRTGQVFLRLFEEPQDLCVYVLVDMSASMFFEAPPRADAARQIAAVIATVSLNQHDRVSVYPFGADLGDGLSARSGAAGIQRVLGFLERLRPAGPTDLPRSIRRFGAMRQRSGLAVVISDFFDPQGIDAVLRALGSLRHHLLLVQVACPSDAAPDLGGELRLLDCESGAGVDVAVTPRALERYRASYQAFSEALTGFAARRRAAHLKLNAEAPVLAQLGELFVDGVFVT